MKFGLTDDNIERIQKIFENDSKIDEVIIFGSRAKGNYKEGSDIDLAVKGRNINFDDTLKLTSQLDDLNLPYKIDLLDYANTKDKDIIEHIDRVGLVFFSKWKETEFGKIPHDWNYEPLENFLNLITYGFTNPMPTTIEGPVMITAKDINEGRIKYESARRTSWDAYNTLLTKKSKPEINDVLVTKDGSIGRIAIVNRNDICISQSVALIRCNDRIVPLFLKYLLEAPQYQDLIERDADGSTIKHVYITRINKMLTGVPCVKEQNKIIETIDCLQNKIDLLSRQNKTLEQLAETLFKQWFVEEADESWKVGKLDDVISVKGGTTPSTTKPEYWDGTINWTSPRDLSNNNSIFLFDTDRKITKQGLEQIGSGLLPVGTVLLSSRAPIGYLVITQIPVAINQGYIAVVCDKIISNWFIYLWIKSNLETIINAANGSVFLEISKSTFKELQFVIPPTEKLKFFDTEAEPLFQKIKTNIIEVKTLTLLRDSLLPKLMSGEIRVDINGKA